MPNQPETAPTADLSCSSPSRALLDRDRVIEELRQKLQSKEKEVDNLLQRNSYLSREVRYLTEVVQHLNQRLAEVEADQQAAQEKIRSLLNRRVPAVPPAPTVTKPTVEPGQLGQVSRLTRELNVSSKQLRSTALQALADMKNQLEELRGAVGGLSRVEQEVAGETEQLRRLYRKEALERKTLHNKLLELQGNIRVFCRCRKSRSSSLCLETTAEDEVLVVQKGSRKKFHFDKVYPQSSTQVRTFPDPPDPPATGGGLRPAPVTHRRTCLQELCRSSLPAWTDTTSAFWRTDRRARARRTP